MTEQNNLHPCFSAAAKEKYGRIHLPVAPKCNVSCVFCSRKYDCVNESRPGVSSTLLSPEQAGLYYEQMKESNPWLTVAGIAGPGDAFANPVQTLRTLEIIRKIDNEVLFCVSTNGLELAPFIDELVALKVRHITVTVNAVNPGIGEKIYRWVGGKAGPLRKIAGAAYLLDRQEEAIQKAAEAGMTVKINSIILPGINDFHIPLIAEKTAEWGASTHNCLPVILSPDAHLPESVTEPDRFMIHRVRKESEKYLPQMGHCGRCRADAVGLLAEKNQPEVTGFLQEMAMLHIPSKHGRMFIAAVSMEGLLVNLHLGDALVFMIFDPVHNGQLVEERIAPPKGGGDTRWQNVAEILSDCHTLLVSGIGERPKTILGEAGIAIYIVEGLISDLIQAIGNNHDLASFKKRVRQDCSGGPGCGGNAAGCM